MKIIKFIAMIIPTLLLLTGCGNGFSDKNYSYESNGSDPKLIFTSDYDDYTYFWLNSDNLGESRICSNTHPVGYLFKSDSIFNFKENITNLDVTVPANKEITVTGNHEGSKICGPISRAFTPKKNKTYVIQYEKAGNYCRLNVIDKSNNEEVTTRKLGSCVK